MDIFNKKFGFSDDEKLQLAPEEEQDMNQDNNKDEEGAKYEYRQQSANR